MFYCHWSSFCDLQNEINFETNIPPKDQFIHYEECMLRDIISETETIPNYPKMSESTPLVLIRSTAVKTCTMPDEKKFWYHEKLFGKHNLL